MVRLLLAILMAVTFFTPSAFSGETPVRVFSVTDYPLILEKDGSNGRKGLAADILDRISTELDTRFEVKFYPWKRALLEVKNGSVDGIIGAYETAERRQFLDYSEKPFFRETMVIVARDDWKGRWNGDWQTLKGEKILQMRGWAYGTDFEAWRKFLNVKTVNNPKDAFLMLFQRHADLVVVTHTGALFEIKRGGYAKIRIVGPSFQSYEGYFAFSKKIGDKAFQRRFNSALNRMWRDGEIVRLLSKYRLSNPLDPK